MTGRRRRAIVLISLFVLTLPAPAARAQETRSDTLLTTQHYLEWERVSDAQISPDGARVVYTRQHVNQLEDRWESSLWIVTPTALRTAFS
jgi:hypothetical protein